MLRAVLIGAGSIGGSVAVMITTAGYPLDVVAHGEEKAALYRDPGFRLTGAFGDQQVSLRSYPSIDAMEGTYDVCFIATKYQQMPSVARAMLPHLREDSLVVSLQNGIVLDLLSEVVGEDRTVGVMIGYGATLLEPNLVEVTAGDEFRIGMPKGHTSPRLKELAEMMSAVLPTRVDDDIVARLFSKVVFNSCINSVCGISGLDLGKALHHRPVRMAMLDIMREGDAVAQAMGLDVPRFNVLPKNSFIAAHHSRFFNAFMGRFLEVGMGIRSGKVHPSTLQSLEKGKKTEIDIMNGYLSAKGAEYGVSTPVNDWMTRTIREIENGSRPISKKNIRELGKAFY